MEFRGHFLFFKLFALVTMSIKGSPVGLLWLDYVNKVFVL